MVALAPLRTVRDSMQKLAVPQIDRKRLTNLLNPTRDNIQAASLLPQDQFAEDERASSAFRSCARFCPGLASTMLCFGKHMISDFFLCWVILSFSFGARPIYVYWH